MRSVSIMLLGNNVVLHLILYSLLHLLLCFVLHLLSPRTDRQTDRHTDRQTDRHTDRQTYRQTERQTERQTDRQTDRPNSLFRSTCYGLQLQCHSMTIKRRPALRPERSLPHRPPTRIMVIIYKLTVLSM